MEQNELQNVAAAYQNCKAENERARDALEEVGILLWPESQEITDGIRELQERQEQLRKAAGDLVICTEKWQRNHVISLQMKAALDAVRAALKELHL